MPPDAPGPYFVGRLGGGDVAAVGAPSGDAPATWNTYVWVESADDTATKVRDAGGTVITEPFDVGDARRMAVCADPDGAAFSLWQAKAHRGAKVVNEHGSLNFNDLVTRDLERAAAFYGAVFGWEVLGLGDGAMWALPAYGDFLEQLRPGMREGMASIDRKSTRLSSSHANISYAVFCLKKKHYVLPFSFNHNRRPYATFRAPWTMKNPCLRF